jgi:hypothetical protein
MEMTLYMRQDAEILLLRARRQAGGVRPRGDDELRKLLKERYNTAVRELRTADQEFRAGRITTDDLLRASRRVLHAQLELADRPAEQVAACEKYLDYMKDVEKLMLTGFNAGRVKPADMEMTRYMRQDAEVLLLRAQRQAGGVRPRGDDELRKLLKERYSTAVRELGATYQEFLAGRIVPDRVFDCSRRVLHAQLELTDRPTEQIAAYEKYLDFLKEVEKLTLPGFNAGRVPRADMEMTLYMRQDAEILLLRAQRKAGGVRPR